MTSRRYPRPMLILALASIFCLGLMARPDGHPRPSTRIFPSLRIAWTRCAKRAVF